MDAVNAFNTELFSMIDMKPPISRAKMMAVTKSAIKAIKLYKHVVQIVEKFIKKCKPELKVPGLYVVDSIIRQSRHQFGVEKDLFGPRFLKNFTETFQNLYQCPENEKSKIVRVLNLWQKNAVFDMDILQPLMDMANGDIDGPSPVLDAPAESKPETTPFITSSSVVSAAPLLPGPDALAAVAQLFQSPQGLELQKMLQNFQQVDKTVGSVTASNNVTHDPQLPFTQVSPCVADTMKKNSLAEKLLDRFDYDDEPEEVPIPEGTIQSQGIPENMSNHFPSQMMNTEMHPERTAQTVDLKYSGGLSHTGHHVTQERYNPVQDAHSHSLENSRESQSLRSEGRHSGYGRRSRSRSRSPRRRRSRSNSRSRWSRQRQSRSREKRWRSRSSSQDRSEREKDRERRQRGLPSIKSQTLSVCTTTLWVGQLDKKTTQSDVMSFLEEFGQIESINMIPPRGCAYIVMVHRQDAYTALKKLSRGSYKVNQKSVKIAWALNKGIKSAHKRFWDVEQGVTYIPWNKVKFEELESYLEGGVFDPETLNPEWKIVKDFSNQVALNGAMEVVPGVTGSTHVQIPTVQPSEPFGGSPAFPSPIMLSPTSLPPGGAPFINTEFEPANTAGGRMNVPEETIGNAANNGPYSDLGSGNQLGSPSAQLMTPPNPAMMQGPPRPDMPPLHSPPGMTNPHLHPFPAPQNIQHMMPGQMFPPGRFRMPMHFPPRGPPFQQYPPVQPEMLSEQEGGPFGAGRPRFGRPPFHRGRW